MKVSTREPLKRGMVADAPLLSTGCGNSASSKTRISAFDATQLEIEVGRNNLMDTVNQLGNQQRGPVAKLHRRSWSQPYRMDPKYLEYQAARRSALLSSLKASYADQGDTFGWAVIVWSASMIALSPFLGTLAAAALSIFVTLAWATVHKVRCFSNPQSAVMELCSMGYNHSAITFRSCPPQNTRMGVTWKTI